MRTERQKTGFRECQSCKTRWTTRASFVSDPELKLVGYQANFVHLEKGFFMFNHTHKGCGTTLAIPVMTFADLYDGPVFRERATGGPACPGHCLHEDDVAPCPEHCECAYVREIMQILNQTPKSRKKSERE
jgi:hypothetical protein